MNEDGDGTRLRLNAPMRSTNPEKWDSSISNIRDTRISLEKIFFGIFSQRIFKGSKGT
jgi:hypothetical protein